MSSGSTLHFKCRHPLTSHVRTHLNIGSPPINLNCYDGHILSESYKPLDHIQLRHSFSDMAIVVHQAKKVGVKSWPALHLFQNRDHVWKATSPLETPVTCHLCLNYLGLCSLTRFASWLQPLGSLSVEIKHWDQSDRLEHVLGVTIVKWLLLF